MMIMIMIMCQATPDSATTSGEMNSSKLAQYEINLSFCGLVGMLDLPRNRRPSGKLSVRDDPGW